MPPFRTGKTALAQSMMEQLPKNRWIAHTINFSPETSNNQRKETIESRTDKHVMNLPLPDLFDSQPPLELLRKWMDYPGWCDRGEGAEVKAQ
ncbi:hypothetical protein BLNAU_9241 [Blattamonas nauphoetae]|uniref:Uncharacterized protein n=1 Tax=Blattamonas nauphoetae TaxID=2049346 RepID=A0ABQ9XWM8_9EUKA|nr:hypothetical protein BLNAU_9241 [Blattamonas nauphoetae]